MRILYLCFLTLPLAAVTSLASTIFWSNSFSPPTVETLDLGTLSTSFADDTNTFSLVATSLDITNFPLSAVIGTTITPTLAISLDLGYTNHGDANNESGLGIMTNTDAEVRLGYALQIDLSAFPTNTDSFVITSIDLPAEGFRIWGSTTANGPMTLLVQGDGAGGFTQTATFQGGTYNCFDLTSNTPNGPVSSVLLRSLSTSTVPEPASLPIMGLGTIGLLLFRKRYLTGREGLRVQSWPTNLQPCPVTTQDHRRESNES